MSRRVWKEETMLFSIASGIMSTSVANSCGDWLWIRSSGFDVPTIVWEPVH